MSKASRRSAFRGRAELPLTELAAARPSDRRAHRGELAAGRDLHQPMSRCIDTGAAIGKPLGLSASAMPGSTTSIMATGRG